jgi:hypothetical protein
MDSLGQGMGHLALVDLTKRITCGVSIFKALTAAASFFWGEVILIFLAMTKVRRWDMIFLSECLPQKKH